jgi:cytochrome b pre-mRNA-processing protein 3
MVFRVLSQFPALFGLARPRGQAAAERLYLTAVEAARRPDFYADLGVPDTVEGRFDMVTIHVYLLLERLKADGAAAKDFAQTVFDTMFQNMDDSLREMGVGDLRVGKKVRELAEMFYGRVGAYETAFAAAEPEALTAAVGRNVLGSATAPGAPALADYMRKVKAHLAALPSAELAQGQVSYPPIATQEEAANV